MKNLFKLLTNFSIATYLSRDDYPQIIDATALKLLTEIAKTDKEFGKHVISNNPYLAYLKNDVLDLSVPETELDEESAKQRKAWIDFFKEYFPDELAKFI